jgi:hypothetical protein
MGPARIYPWRKMHRSRAPSLAPGAFFVAQPWADCITNMPGFNLRQAHPMILTDCPREKLFDRTTWPEIYDWLLEIFPELLQAVQSRLKDFVILENQAARAI